MVQAVVNATGNSKYGLMPMDGQPLPVVTKAWRMTRLVWDFFHSRKLAQQDTISNSSHIGLLLDSDSYYSIALRR